MKEQQEGLIAKKDPLLASLEIRGMDMRQFRVIKEILYPNVQDQTLLIAVDYCKARNLDIMKRTIQIVPIWDSKAKCMKDTIWPSIAEVRITATRTGKYAGKSKTLFGPIITENLDGITVSYPEWCEMTVYRLVNGQKCEFPTTLYWKETYKTAKNDTIAPNSMWSKRNRAQLEKCTEAAALRAAFPEEVGNDYIGEEAFDANEGLINVTPKSKTASAHQIPTILEKSFTATQNIEIAKEQIDLFDQNSDESDEDETKKEKEGLIEAAFKRVSDGLKSMKNTKAINSFFDYSAKEDLEYLSSTRPDQYAELLSLKNKCLEGLSK